ncbi:hypothetical protein HDU89_001891, partial [Geranomyces variabilis]
MRQGNTGLRGMFSSYFRPANTTKTTKTAGHPASNAGSGHSDNDDLGGEDSSQDESDTNVLRGGLRPPTPVLNKRTQVTDHDVPITPASKRQHALISPTASNVSPVAAEGANIAHRHKRPTTQFNPQSTALLSPEQTYATEYSSPTQTHLTTRPARNLEPAERSQQLEMPPALMHFLEKLSADMSTLTNSLQPMHNEISQIRRRQEMLEQRPAPTPAAIQEMVDASVRKAIAEMRVDGFGGYDGADLRHEEKATRATAHTDVTRPTLPDNGLNSSSANNNIRVVDLDPASILEFHQPRFPPTRSYANAVRTPSVRDEFLATRTPEEQKRVLHTMNAINQEKLRRKAMTAYQLPPQKTTAETMTEMRRFVVLNLPRGPYTAMKDTLRAAGANPARIENMTWMGSALEVLVDNRYADELAGIFTLLGARVDPDFDLYAPQKRGVTAQMARRSAARRMASIIFASNRTHVRAFYQRWCQEINAAVQNREDYEHDRALREAANADAQNERPTAHIRTPAVASEGGIQEGHR